MLYIVATPIGNLADITYRAVDTLKSCDYILCEDTRHSLTLLKHYDIKTHLKSFHKFNEKSKHDPVLNDLSQGKIIALISDAGTPAISDPGSELIRACVDNGFKVIAIPGPCAAIAALCVSGLTMDCFQFVGFLPKKNSEREHILKNSLSYHGVTICYESPNRLVDTLDLLHKLAPQRLIVVAREMTKKFEEIQRGTPDALSSYWKASPPKGELVLMISGAEPSNEQEEWLSLSPQQHVELVQTTYAISRQEAVGIVAKIRGAKKRDIYQAVCIKEHS